MHPTDRADLRRAQAHADLLKRLEGALVAPLEGDDTQPAALELLARIRDALDMTRRSEPAPLKITRPHARATSTETETESAETHPEHRAHVAPYSTAPRVVLVQTWGDDMSPVEAARVSTGHLESLEAWKEEHYTADAPPSPVDLTACTRAPLTPDEEARADRLRRYLWQHRHTTPYEHAGATFALSVPLYIARQVMRHRTLSFSEVSRRYTSEGLEIWTPAPEHMRPQHPRALQCSREGEQIERAEELAAKMEAHAHASAALYEELLEAGLAREVARAVLPCSTFTRFYLSGNLLNLARFLRLRLDSHAQPEAQEVAREVLRALAPHFPKTCALIFEESTEHKGGPL